MNIAIAGAISVIISYLLGSLNSPIIVIRFLKREDIRNHGSKNAGLTNVFRCFGKTAAVFTLIGDLAKGVIAVLLSWLTFRLFGYNDPHMLKTVGYIAGLFAIIGHVFPIYYGFKGGKGVLSAASILIVVDPLTFLVIIPFFAVIILITKYVSIASISAAVFYPLLTFSLNYFLRETPMKHCFTYTLLVLLTSIVLIYMHKTNIARLKAGTEAKITDKKRVKDDSENG